MLSCRDAARLVMSLEALIRSMIRDGRRLRRLGNAYWRLELMVGAETTLGVDVPVTMAPQVKALRGDDAGC